MAVEEADVALQAFAFGKFGLDVVYELVFFRRQRVRVLGIDRREVLGLQFIRLAIESDDAFFPINLVEQQAVVHIVVGMAVNGLTFQLGHDDVDGLDHGLNAVVLFIRLQGKEGKGPKADAIAAF